MATKVLNITSLNIDKSNKIEQLSYELVYEVKNEKNITDFVKNTYTPKAGDKLFFTKDCSVPRFKVKTLCEKKDLLVTRDRSKANTVFVSNDFLTAFVDNYWLYFCSLETFIKFIEKTPYASDKSIIDMLGFIMDNKIEKIAVNYHYHAKFNTVSKTLGLVNGNLRICTSENFEMIREVLTPGNVYIQDDILKILNQDVIIDKDMYLQISTMFTSTDNSNIKIAMEILANSDYEKSAPYILLTFMNHGHSIWDSGFRNHINFKSLVEFFNLNGRRSYTHLDLDEIVDILKAKNFLTKETIDIFMPLAYSEIKDRVGYEHFKVSKIKFVEDPKDDDEEILNIEDEESIF